ncbi:MAG: hypothetical protein IJB96_02880 [Lachnospira sp.]|nr:hypothetical protein [Lachnospira sp.]
MNSGELQCSKFISDKGVEFEFEPTDDGSVSVVSTTFSGITEFNIADELEREHMWGDFIKGAVVTLSRKYKLTKGFRGCVTGTLPTGGLSSSAAVILAKAIQSELII